MENKPDIIASNKLPLPDNNLSSEQREPFGKPHLNTISVLGQGPVKAVLIPGELSPEQNTVWEKFKADPLHEQEPDFRVVEADAFLSELDDIHNRRDINEEEKNKLVEEKRGEWQKTGRFGLNRWGRQNALAAGLMLYTGLTDKLVLSGGKTMPGWVKEGKSPVLQKRMSEWPSEAQLMRDIIVGRFGRLMFEKEMPDAAAQTNTRARDTLYEKFINERLLPRLVIEDTSTNTLENYAYILNRMGSQLEREKVGILATDSHLRRAVMLSRRFFIEEATRGQFSAQELLKERAEMRGKSNYLGMIEYMKNTLTNKDLRERLRGEERWERGLLDPDYLAYWLGYFSQVADIKVLQRVLGLLKDPDWVEAARKEFARAELNFDEFSDVELDGLERNHPEKSEELRAGLQKLKGPLRTVPPA